VPTGSGDAGTAITDTTRVIAVNIPNIQGVRFDPWQNYLTSVNHLQTNTGFTFFTALNSNVAAVLRAKVDGAPPASITDFTPANGPTNTSVVVTGTNFTGATVVQFNGQNTTFTADSDQQITATVPPGATTGPISVIAAGGLTTSAALFTVNSPVVAQPMLSIALFGPEIVLSWPSAATNYSLQQNPDLNSTNWTGYDATVIDDGTTKTVTVTNSGSSLFFRLLTTTP